MYFSLAIPLYIYILLAGALLLTVATGLWQWLQARRLARFVQRDEPARDYLDEEQLPSISVVVYAHNDAASLEQLLPLMLEQDYKRYEVIVVDDGSYDDSRDVVSEMMQSYGNLRLSFSPDDTRSLSRKKLSLMIGIKAAKGDIIVTTNANCRVMSNQWLRLLARNFVAGIDVVLGYSHYHYSRDKKPGRYYRIYDTAVTARQWVLSAVDGVPYRGVSDNLAYRRQVFFDNAGFSGSIDLRWGDDDVYVSQIANGGNTRLELSPGSQVQAYYDDVARAHNRLKLRRDFTSKLVATRAPFIAQGFFSTLNYARLACLVAAVALDWDSAVVVILAAVLAVASWAIAIAAFDKSAQPLQVPKLALCVPLFAAWRPVVNMAYRLRGIKTKQNNYTSIYD